MPLYLDPADLKEQPLTLHELAQGDYSVRVVSRVAGRIMLRTVAGSRSVWFWSLTGPYIPADMQPSSGEAETLLEAKAAFRAKFDAWLAWATELGHPVAWMG